MKIKTYVSAKIAFALGLGFLVAGSASGQAKLTSHFEFENNFTNSSSAPNGIPNGGPGFVAGPAGFGQAVSFDGSNQYVGLTTTGLNSVLFDNNLTGTATFWIKSTEGTAETSLLGVFDSSRTNQAIGISQNVSQVDQFRLFIRENSGSSNYRGFTATDTSWRDGDWHHYAVTWSATGPDSDWNLYVDGQLVSKNSQFDNIPDANLDEFNTWTDEAVVGARNDKGTVDQHFEGAMDDLRLYDGVLTQSEIQSIIPEPSTYAFLGGLLALGLTVGLRRRR